MVVLSLLAVTKLVQALHHRGQQARMTRAQQQLLLLRGARQQQLLPKNDSEQHSDHCVCVIEQDVKPLDHTPFFLLFVPFII